MKSVTPFIIIALCIGMYFMYISPQLADIQVKIDRKNEYAAALDKVKELKDKKDALSTKYNSIPQEDVDMLNKIIPKQFDPVYFANDVNSISSKYGMAVKDIKINYVIPRGMDGVQVGDTNYKIIDAKLKLNGKYDQFMKFLKDLESSLRLLDVINLDVRVAGTKKGEEVNLEYTLEIRTYSLQ